MKNKVTKVINEFGGKTRVRVCGVLIEEGRMLLTEHLGLGPKGRLLIPPGGGLEFGESVTECLQREFREETGLEVTVKDFLFIHEYVNLPLHAIEIFFLVERNGGSLMTGNDPELTVNEQIIVSTKFYSSHDIAGVDPEMLHNMLQKEPDPIKFEHLRGFYKFALNS